MSKHISASKRGFCLYIVAFYLFQIRKRNVLHTIKLRYLELSYLKLKFFYLGYCFQSFSNSDLQPWTSQTFLVNYTNKKKPEIELIGKVFFTWIFVRSVRTFSCPSVKLSSVVRTAKKLLKTKKNCSTDRQSTALTFGF